MVQIITLECRKTKEMSELIKNAIEENKLEDRIIAIVPFGAGNTLKGVQRVFIYYKD